MVEVYTVKNGHIDFSRVWVDDRTVKHTVHDVHEVVYGRHSSIVSIGKLACHRLEINHLEKIKHPEDAYRDLNCEIIQTSGS
jgi:aquaporin TIP